MEALASEFFDAHLLGEKPRAVLTSELRWAVAKCARDALMDCEGCSGLPQDACLRDNFQGIADLEHSEFPAVVLEGNTSAAAALSPEVASTLLNLVHAVVNHQTKANNAEWYGKTMEALDATGLVPQSFRGVSRGSMLASLYAEVVAVATTSHSLHVEFLALQREVPPLPSPEDVVREKNQQSSTLDLTSTFREGAKIRQDEASGFAPYFLPEDLDEEKAEQASALSAETLDALKTSLIPMIPTLGLCFSPTDFVMINKVIDTNLYDTAKVRVRKEGREE